jgi:hypothetical protein
LRSIRWREEQEGEHLHVTIVVRANAQFVSIWFGGALRYVETFQVKKHCSLVNRKSEGLRLGKDGWATGNQ